MKRIAKPLLAGLVLGVSLAVLQNALQIDQTIFWLCFGIAAVAVLVGSVLFNFFYIRGYGRKINEVTALLNEGRPNEYIAATEELLRTARGRYLKNVLKLNLSAGYYDLKQYGQAIAILEELSQERLKGPAKAVQQLNLCASYFRAGQTAKAMELYEANQGPSSPWRTMPALAGNAAVLDMRALIVQGRQDEAAKLLEHARVTWTDPRLQKSFDQIEALLTDAWPTFPTA